MDKKTFIRDFINELAFFKTITDIDLKNNFTIEQVEDELIRFTSSFYGARLDFDEYAVRKCYFIATYPYQIIKGTLDNDLIDELYDEIEEEKRIRV